MDGIGLKLVLDINLKDNGYFFVFLNVIIINIIFLICLHGTTLIITLLLSILNVINFEIINFIGFLFL